MSQEALERKLADEQLRGLLVAPDLTKSDSAAVGACPVAVGLLDTSHGWSGLVCGLACKLLARGLASRGSARCLLGAYHVWTFWALWIIGGYLFVYARALLPAKIL